MKVLLVNIDGTTHSSCDGEPRVIAIPQLLAVGTSSWARAVQFARAIVTGLTLGGSKGHPDPRMGEKGKVKNAENAVRKEE